MDSLGTYLRHERELRQISLEEISQTTRIPLRTLQHLEDDDLDRLPGEVFVRGFLKSYARSVGLDLEEVLERHARRHDEKPAENEAPVAPIASVQHAEGGRRFGIAIALVILLILFTLALSIVMRPRHRDTPIELSSVSPAAASVDVV